MLTAFFYNGIFFIFKFPARLVYNLIYGKECWTKHRKTQPKECLREEGSLGMMMFFSLLFGILAIWQHETGKNRLVYLFAFALLTVIIVIVRDIISAKKGKGQEFIDAYDKMIAEEEAAELAAEQKREEKAAEKERIETAVSDRQAADGEIKCPHCGNVQSAFIKRCLNCGEMIEE